MHDARDHLSWKPQHTGGTRKHTRPSQENGTGRAVNEAVHWAVDVMHGGVGGADWLPCMGEWEVLGGWSGGGGGGVCALTRWAGWWRGWCVCTHSLGRVVEGWGCALTRWAGWWTGGPMSGYGPLDRVPTRAPGPRTPGIATEPGPPWTWRATGINAHAVMCPTSGDRGQEKGRDSAG